MTTYLRATTKHNLVTMAIRDRLHKEINAVDSSIRELTKEALAQTYGDAGAKTLLMGMGKSVEECAYLNLRGVAVELEVEEESLTFPLMTAVAIFPRLKFVEVNSATLGKAHKVMDEVNKLDKLTMRLTKSILDIIGHAQTVEALMKVWPSSARYLPEDAMSAVVDPLRIEHLLSQAKL